jgi:diamine N-acetyltransferase
MSSPAENGTVALVDITRENYRPFLKLQVAPGQERFVASNAVSMAQAHFHPEATLFGIVAGATPVGFAMLEDHTKDPAHADDTYKKEPYVGLWRFMIAADQQRHGYGGAALQQLIAYARTREPAQVMLLSYVLADGGPRAFYARHGFVETGEVSEGEHVMRLAL